ncbi:MAG: hypothetical protein GX568_05590 [Candidatus Gastranaerophilales bacterium]|nr:hypothetical protein [Candidatus Gastranaerophilales bacterium]
MTNSGSFTLCGVIQVKNDTGANWASNNPTLAQGEMGLETDTNKFKFGDGTTVWSSLPYAGGGANSSFKYGLYKLSANQTSNLTVGCHIQFDMDEGSLGGLSTGSGQENGIITLAGGKTYKATYGWQENGSSTSSAAICLYDRTNSVYLGTQNWKFPSTNQSNNTGSDAGLGIFTPESEIDVEVRIVDQDISSIISTCTYLLIEEYGGY